MLETVVMGDLKYARSGEPKRALGSFVGSNLEENSFRGAHLKNSPPASVEVTKGLRSSVSDSCVKARSKKQDLHLNKLNKFCVAMPSKKQQQQQWNELLTNELISGSTLKTGLQMHRNLLDPGSQIFYERPKSVVLNKRTRTSVAEALVERRNNGVLRQSLIVTKERDMLKDNNEDSDTTEEKIMNLPAGGEGWDKTTKRKHSAGDVFFRSVDNDGEVKRNLHHKLTIESTMKANDLTHGFRSGASGGFKKLGPMPSPVDSTAPLTLKNEQEKYVLSRDLSGRPIKELPLEKLNVKLNNRMDNYAMGSDPVVKGKASRAPQSGPVAAADSAANVSLLSGTLESWEQAPVNKTSSVGGADNRKRAMPTVSCSPSITHWGGQRPQKITRTRRTNIVPVSNFNEVHMQSEGCSPSEFGSPRIRIVGMNASPLSKSATSGNGKFNVKPENVPSNVRLSKSEEYGAGEISINDKGVASRELEENSQVGASAIPMKKNKFMAKEETGDGVRRQGCTGTMSPFSRPSNSTTRDKMDTVVPTKPFQTGCDKSGSKSGRPLKRLSDRKGFSRGSYMANGGSPDCNGDSDDLEELQTAANLACSSSFIACSSPFWKTFDALFASVDSDEKSYLSEQDDFCGKTMETSDSISCQRNGSIESKNELKNPLGRVDNVEHLQFSSPCRFSDSERKFDVVTPPLYQRLLSAMIVEDETKESEGTRFVIRRSSVDDSFPIGSENKLCGRLDFHEPVFGVQTQKNGNGHKIFPCKRSTDITGFPSSQAHVSIDELIQRDGGNVHSEVELLVGLSRCDYVPKSLRANNAVISSSDFQYEQMCLEEKLAVELESVGLFLEAVPALDDNEDEFFNEELAQLEKRLYEQIGRKRTCLDKIYKSAQGENMARDPEQVAMDKLVELAYKKLFDGRTVDACETSTYQSDVAISENVPMSNRAKRKELFLNDVSGGAGIFGGAKGKRSERDRDRDVNTKGDRKTKAKLKQKTTQLSMSGNAFITDRTNHVNPSGSGSGDLLNNGGGNRLKDVVIMSAGNAPLVPSNKTKECMDLAKLPFDDIDGIEELGVDSEIGAPQDINSWLSFDVDGLQDHDGIGLEIPNDDLSELNMF